MRRNKYNNIRSGGYDSKLERNYADKLSALYLAGEIQEFVHHPPSIKMCGGTITWAIDYLVILNGGQKVYVEVKGMPTPEFKLKFKLYCWLKVYWDGNMPRN